MEGKNESKHTPELIPNYLSERIAFLADTTSAGPWESGRMKIFATRVASEMILNKDNNLIAVINNQSDRIIESEQSSKALLRMIERLEGELSEMKKEREELVNALESIVKWEWNKPQEFIKPGTYWTDQIESFLSRIKK